MTLQGFLLLSLCLIFLTTPNIAGYNSDGEQPILGKSKPKPPKSPPKTSLSLPLPPSPPSPPPPPPPTKSLTPSWSPTALHPPCVSDMTRSQLENVEVLDEEEKLQGPLQEFFSRWFRRHRSPPPPQRRKPRHRSPPPRRPSTPRLSKLTFWFRNRISFWDGSRLTRQDDIDNLFDLSFM
ncbi:unnamed protein product [Ilex paraguariensis]|uniref:Uncharacterized protein n=1 Tax=Ilex paraguariensis TaxID=185542 RepID=A0ABC8SZ29_9AQUA